MKTQAILLGLIIVFLLQLNVQRGFSQNVVCEIFNPRPENIQQTTAAPLQTLVLTSLEAWLPDGLSAQSRIRGFILPPDDGYYRIYGASDWGGSFYMSTDSTENNRRLLYLNKYGNWNWPVSLGNTDSLFLLAGKPYYFETFFTNYMKIGWAKPGSNNLQLITGEYLKRANPKLELSVDWEIFKNKISYDFITLRNSDSIPDQIIKLDSLNTKNNTTQLDHFSSRMRGYLVPPTTGNYSFYFACDNVGQFWLSTDTTGANAQLKSEITAIQSDWSQNVSIQTLVAGQKYFFEILHYDTVYTDLVKLGWKIPGDSVPVVIKSPYIMSCSDHVSPANFSFLDNNITFYPDWTFTPRYILTPWNSRNKCIRWESLDPAIATVNSYGVITTLSPGQCRIKASMVEDLFITDTLELSVTNYYGPYFVKQNASLNGNGYTWDNAIPLTKLLDILNQGRLDQQITVYLSEGIYKPTNTIDRNKSFTSRNSLKIIGGFSETSTGSDTTSRDIEKYETIFSGNIGLQAESIDNSYHVVKIFFGTSDWIPISNPSVLDGITIRDGRASASTYGIHFGYGNSDDNGGGLFNGSNLMMINCRITNNSAWNGGGGLQSQGFLNLYNCSIDSNHIQQQMITSGGGMFEVVTNGYGGGMFLHGGTFNAKNSTFSYNTSYGYGQAFFLVSSGVANFESCSFFKNRGPFEDIWAKDGSTLNLNNSTVFGSVVSYFLSTANIKNSTIVGGGFATDQEGKINLDNSIWTNVDLGRLWDTNCLEAKNSIVNNILYGNSKNNLISDSIMDYSFWLDTLAYNGGPTPTAKLKTLPYNPAKSNGNPLYLDSLDQRGAIRSDSVSIGAYQWVKPGVISLSPQHITFCQGDSINFAVTVMPDLVSDNSYTKSSSNSSIAQVAGTRIFALAPGNAEIIVQSMDGGLTDTCKVTVIGAVATGAISGTSSVCKGQNSITYSTSPIANATSYLWTLPPGASGSSDTSSITVDFGTNAVSGEIAVQGTNSCGKGGISAISITLNPVYSISESHSICSGETYTWHGTEYATAGIFPASYTSISGCDSTFELNLAVNSVDTGVTQAGIVLTANATADRYQWIDSDNGYKPISGEVHQSFTASANGTYAVIVIEGLCSDTSVFMKVLSVGITHTVSPKTIRVYPNPVSDELTIEISGNTKNIDFEIVNALEQLVHKGSIIEKTLVNTADFLPGIYLIKFFNGKMFEKVKIVKE